MICEHCHKEIKDGEDFYFTADVVLHEKCYPRKEFAADAKRDADRAQREVKR